jgi:hypothetical protein
LELQGEQHLRRRRRRHLFELEQEVAKRTPYLNHPKLYQGVHLHLPHHPFLILRGQDGCQGDQQYCHDVS